ncbi:MAG: hypothetical protein JOZ40_20070 [Methylobacteriaceae bacterium]|nr:hypothetical protein [Methylobacteriaceae bacterium]
MALTFSPPAQDLVDALAMMAEREGPDGRSWCPAPAADAIRTCILDRTNELGLNFLQVVRFVRLAALAAPRGYVDFLYLAVPILRRDAFKAAVEQAQHTGRFPPGTAEVEGQAVRLLEPAMATEAVPPKPFEITYAQMAQLAAFLDVLHNTLGFAEVADIVAPLTGLGPPKSSAADVARTLRARFHAWLDPRLESGHQRQKAKVIHAFLAARKAMAADMIDDAVILDFWRQRAIGWHERTQTLRAKAQLLRDAGKDARPIDAEAESAEKAARDEGFRVFRTCVRSLLRYRALLQETHTAGQLKTPSSMFDARRQQPRSTEAWLPPGGGGPEEETGPPSELDSHHVDDEAWENPLAAIGGGRWQNPLADLVEASEERVKWLTDKEALQLHNYIGQARSTPDGEPDEDGNRDDEGDEAGGARSSGLVEAGPFDLRLVRTLLRADVFGAAQASIIARLKKRQTAQQALDAGLGPIEASAYGDAAEAYRALHAQLRLESLAAIQILGMAGDPAVVLIADQLGATALKTAILAARAGRPVAEAGALRGIGNHGDDGLRRTAVGAGELGRIRDFVAALFRSGRHDDREVQRVLDAAKQARRAVHRTGFRKEDESDPAARLALQRGAPAVARLVAQLDQLIARIDRLPLSEAAQTDRAAFAEVLGRIYGAETAAAKALPEPIKRDSKAWPLP